MMNKSLLFRLDTDVKSEINLPLLDITTAIIYNYQSS